MSPTAADCGCPMCQQSRIVECATDPEAETADRGTITDFLIRRIEEDEIRAEYVRQFGDPGGLFRPERILAECEAKRAVIDWWINGEIGYVRVDGELTNPLIAFAAVYKDHPDYKEEWAV